MVHLRFRIGAKDPIRIGPTHIEFSVPCRGFQTWKSRCVLTFFDQRYCLFWEATVGILGPKTAFEKVSHSQRKVVRQERVYSPTFARFPSACVSPFQKRFAVPIPPCWPPKKGNNFGQKKSTHPEIFQEVV